MHRKKYLSLALLAIVLLSSLLLVSCDEEHKDFAGQGATGIKPFWTYDSNAINGGGKAMVNLWGGNLVVQYTDISFPGRGLPVELRRTYNSQTTYEGCFGKGWTTILDTHLDMGANKITLMDAYGGIFEFTNPQPDGDDTRYTAPPGRNTIFKKLADGTYTEKKKNGTTYFFNTDGKLTRIQHRNSNNYLQINYDGSGFPISIQEASGRFTAIENNGAANVKRKRITKITDPQGREMIYRYTERRLIRSRDPEGHHNDYTYDASGFLSTIANPLDKIYTITYDTAGRVATWQDPLFTVTYAYSENSTTVTDTNDHHLVYTLNQSGNATQIVDSMNYSTALQWDAAMNVTSVTNAKNQVTNFTYDNRGNVLTSTNSLYSTNYTYDASNNLLSTTDGMGKTTTCTYTPTATDPDGVLQSVSTPCGRTVTFAYNDYDEPTTVTNARGYSTAYVYDTDGNITSVTDAKGKTTTITYDYVGEALSTTDSLGRNTSFTYYKDGLVFTVTTPGSEMVAATTVFYYFKDGNRRAILDPLERMTHHYTYDDDGRMLTVKDAKGKITTYTYLKDNLVSTADPSGFTTTMSYDANDRLISRSNPITSESMSYDQLGAVTQKTTALGSITYQYDGLNRVTGVSRPKKTATFTYDNNNNRLSASAVDTGGSSLLSHLDVVYSYDDDNRLVSKTTTLDGTQMESASYDYDGNSNLTNLSKTIQRGLPPTPTALPGEPFTFSYTYSYDNIDRQTSVTNSNGDTFTATYDDVGNMLTINYPDNTSSVRTFDAENRITRVVNDHPRDSPPHVTFSYEYDEVGNCLGFEKDPAYPYTPDFKLYEYDKLNRLVYDEAEQMRFVYDEAGDKIRDQLLSSGLNIVYAYNNAHQVVRRTPGDGLNLPTCHFKYDANGNQTTKRSVRRTEVGTVTNNVINVFDAANRLRSVKKYEKSYNTDELRLISSQESFSYDGDDELFFSENKTYTPPSTTPPPSTATYNFNNVYHGYDFGTLLYKNMTSGTFIEGALYEPLLVHAVEYYTYLNGLRVGVTALAGGDTRNRSTAPPSSAQSTFFVYDGLGNMVQYSNRAGDVPYCMYKYSAYGACRDYESEGDPGRSSYKGYDKGPFGSKCGVRHYDPDTGRFLSPDAYKGNLANPSSQNPYMYCRGNPLKYSDPSGYVISIHYDPQIDKDFPVDWESVQKTVEEGTGDDVRISSGNLYNEGELGNDSKGAYRINIRYSKWLEIKGASAASEEGIVKLFKNQLKNNLNNDILPKYDPNSIDLKRYYTNIIDHELFHALAPGYGHAKNPSDLMYKDPSAEFFREIKSYTQYYRTVLHNRCKNLHW